MKKRKSQGFTLVELISVLCILGVIMVLVIPKGLKQQENAVKTAIKAESRAIVDVATTLKMEGVFKDKKVENITLQDIYSHLDTPQKRANYFETEPNRIRPEGVYLTLNMGYYKDLATADLKRITVHSDGETHSGLGPKQ